VATRWEEAVLVANGSGIVLALGAPALVTLAVATAVWFRAAPPGAGSFAWTFSGVLAVFNIAAMLSVGVLILPVTGCLELACMLRQVKISQHAYGVRAIAASRVISPRLGAQINAGGAQLSIAGVGLSTGLSP
jgi:hypothetical protein